MRALRPREIILVLAILLAIPAAAYGTEPGAAGEFVKTRYFELLGVVKKFPEKARMQQGIRDVMETFVDYPELSKRTLADQWQKLSRKQQSDFVLEFKRMIQRSYVKHFDPGKEFTIDYPGGERSDPDGSVTVPSVIRSGRSEAKVEYVLRSQSGRWLACDVVIDDVSMVRNYRKQFHDIVEKNGFQGLMERLRKKNSASQE